MPEHAVPPSRDAGVPKHVDGPITKPSDPVHRGNPNDALASRRNARHRRVSTDPPEGSDPTPSSEPPRHAAAENDERLKGDKPPHWG